MKYWFSKVAVLLNCVWMVSCSDTSREVFGIEEQTPVENLVALGVTLKESDEIPEQTEYSIRADINLEVGNSTPEYSLSWQLLDTPFGFSMPLNEQTDAPEGQSIINFITPDVDQNTRVQLQITVSYNNGDELENIVKTVDLNIIANKQVVISGAVVDSPIPNAKVQVQLGELLFQTFADSQGNYSLELEFPDPNLVAVVTALGGGGFAEVEFKSYLGDGNVLREDAGGDGIVTSSENNNINVTNISTAEYVLIEDVLETGTEVQTQAQLDELTTQLDVNQVLDVAAVIKAVVDNDDITLPTGKSTVLELLRDDEATELFVDELVAENPTIIEDVKQEIINDPVLIPVDQEFDIANRFFVTKLGDYQSLTTEIMDFKDDGTGDWATYYGTFDVTWQRDAATGAISAQFEQGAFISTDCDNDDSAMCYDRYLSSAKINKLPDSGIHNSLYIEYTYTLVHTLDNSEKTEQQIETYSALDEEDVITIQANDLTSHRWAVRVLDESLDNSGFSYAELPHEIVYASFNEDGTGVYNRVGDDETISFNWKLELGVLQIEVLASENSGTGTTDHTLTYVQTYDRLGVLQMSLVIDAPDFAKVNNKMLNTVVATTATFAPVNNNLDVASTQVEHRFALLESATKLPNFFIQFDNDGLGQHENIIDGVSYYSPFSWSRTELGVEANYYRSTENGDVASCAGEAPGLCYLQRTRHFEILDVKDNHYIVRNYQIFYTHLGEGAIEANLHTSYIGIFQIQQDEEASVAQRKRISKRRVTTGKP